MTLSWSATVVRRVVGSVETTRGVLSVLRLLGLLLREGVLAGVARADRRLAAVAHLGVLRHGLLLLLCGLGAGVARAAERAAVAAGFELAQLALEVGLQAAAVLALEGVEV